MKPKKVKPVSPDDVSKKKRANIPGFIIEAVNVLIIMKYSESTNSSVVKQEDIVDAIVSKGLTTRDEIFNKKWLDIEQLYESCGWIVTYDKPAYCETYPATFEFKKKKTS